MRYLSALLLAGLAFFASAEDAPAQNKELNSPAQVQKKATEERALNLYNYVLGHKVSVLKPEEMSPETGGQFVPQIDEFIDLYMDFLDKGMKPYEAIMMTHTSPLAMEIIKKAKEAKKK